MDTGLINKARTQENMPIRDCVVLLHGLARTSKSMDKIAQAFEHKGYLVVNVNYPSRTDTVEKLSAVA
ncbi:MAG: putative dienelactone hydrolase, partial [Candidatus Azotimanducaceae bacterium]